MHNNQKCIVSKWLPVLGRLLWISVSLLFCGTSFGQDTPLVRGKVLLLDNGEPVPYAHVQVVGQEEVFTRTDEEGRFSLTVPGVETYHLKAYVTGELSGESAVAPVHTSNVNDEIVLEIQLVAEALAVEVVAESPLKQPSQRKMTATELSTVAGAVGDPLKGIQSLPGVAVGDDGSSEPAVRGSFPGDNLYYVDFLPVGYLYHIDGNISVLQADLLESIVFYPSAFGPEFGDRLGAAFDVSLRQPSSKDWARVVDASLLGLSLSAQGPTTENRSLLFGFRKSYLDAVVKLINYEENNDKNLEKVPTYYDYQGKYLWSVDSNNVVSFNLTGADDTVSVDEGKGGQPWIYSEDQSYHAQALVWDSYLGPHSNKMAIGMLSTKYSEVDGAGYAQRTDTSSTYVREQFQYRRDARHFFVFGGELVRDNVSYYEFVRYKYCQNRAAGCDESTNGRIQSNPVVHTGAAYFKDRWHLWSNGTANFGARLSGNDYVKEFYLEPRLSLDWVVGPRTAVTVVWGQYNQRPKLNQLVKEFGNPALGHMRAEHSVLSVSHDWKRGWSGKVDAYYKRMWDLVSRDKEQNYINRDTGKAYGIELLVKKEMTERFSGWLSLTGSRSQQTNAVTGVTYPIEYDQPIIASLVLNSQWANQWFVDVKWSFHSGAPFTPIVAVNAVSDSETGTVLFYRPEYGQANSSRYPAYHRLDIQATKNMRFAHFKLDAYVGIINIYDRSNVNEYVYSPDYSRKSATFQLPIFPTFGLKAVF